MTFRPPFPEVVDSSLISAFRACPRKCFQEYFNHWKPKGLSVHLHAGAAFAKGCEATREAFFVGGRSAEESIALGIGALLHHYGDFECPLDSAKSATRMAGALDFYFSTAWPLEHEQATPIRLANGKRGIEFSFVEPLPVLHPTTHQPLLMSGRADEIVDFASDVYVEDDKTATSLGASWGGKWDLRSQFTCYCWAAHQAGRPVAGVIVRGISILKTKYDSLQSITYRTPWEIDRWLFQVERDLHRMIAMWREGYWDYDLDEACTAYGGCQFKQVCMSRDEAPWLDMNFERRYWNPVTRTETPVEEPEEVYLDAVSGVHRVTHA